MQIFNPEMLSELCCEIKDFRFFSDIKEIRFADDKAFADSRIKNGERYLGYLPTVLPLSDFRRFVEDGDRVSYETPYFERRDALLNLALAELCEGKGRFMRKLCDILWSILEETTWVIPAHYYSERRGFGITAPAPYDHEGVHNIDLFSAGTAGLVSMVYYFLKDKIDAEVKGTINSRIIYELRKKIIEPYMTYSNYWWRKGDNNWNVWISSNLLTTAAVICEDMEERRYFIRECFKSINIWIDGYGMDGGCDEGAGYWDAAGACLFDTLEVLYDMTCGKSEFLFEHPLVKNICDYIRTVSISNDYTYNYGDCHPRSRMGYLSAKFLERIGNRTGNTLLSSFASKRAEMAKQYDNFARSRCGSGTAMAYRAFKSDILGNDTALEYHPAPYEYLPDLQFVAMRTSSLEDKGMYLGITGNKNWVSHNHNDVGNYVIYTDGKPVIIDIGVGTYTKFTFNEMRYKMHFNFRSDGHNLPIICGLTQETGREYAASIFDFDKDEMKVTIGLEKAYYDKDGKIKEYKRTAKRCECGFEILDEISLNGEGDAEFIYYTTEKPEPCKGFIRLSCDTRLETSENDGTAFHEILFDDEVLINDWQRNSIWKITVKAHSIDGKITLRSKFYKN